MKKLLFLFAICAFFTACNDKEDTEEMIQTEFDYLNFGTAYGFCLGECATLYQLTPTALYPDETTSLYQDSVRFSATPLSETKHKIALQLIEEFPEYLNEDTGEVFGCPDCADQGQLYLSLSKNGTVRTWSIDTRKADIPKELHEYHDLLNAVLTQLED